MDKRSKFKHIPKRDFLEMVARMYYVLEMTQKDIADNLGVGRSSIARFLSEAKKEGIVSFYIESKTDTARNADMESKLLKEFKLQDVVVVKSNSTLFEITVAHYLNSVIPFHGSIGIGGGQTMNRLSSFMNVCEPRPNLKVLQTIGGVSSEEKDMPSTSTIQTWSQSLNARAVFLPAPAIVEDKNTKSFYRKNEVIKRALDQLNNLDLIITGIGNVQDIDIIRSFGLQDVDYDFIYEKCAGDINLHFFDKDGNFNLPNISERVMGIETDVFFKAANRIGIAYNENKVRPIKAALRGGLVNVLITTEETAKHLIT